MSTSALSRVDSPHAPSYEDLALPGSQTRVLRLLSGAPDSIVRAELVIVELDDPNHTRYVAASYVWSLLSGTRVVEIDGKTCTVPASAEEVLRNVRRKESTRIVWIDAICINQGNLVEKQHQVSIMGNIYAGAERAIVWLGEENEHTELAFRTLQSIHEQASRDSEDCQRLREVLYGKAQIFQYSVTPLPDSCTPAAMLAVRELFRRPWFKRRWIIQEAALPPEGVVYWGSQNMPVLEMLRAAVWMHHKEDHLGFDIQEEFGMLNASYMSAHVDRDQGWFSRKYGQKQKLADLFRYFQTFDATVVHDRVYALLGLTQWHLEQQPLPKPIIPNYKRDISEVLADATRLATEEAGDLWLFRYIDLAEIPRSGGTPSWVPQLFRAVDHDVDPNHLRSTSNVSKGMVSRYSELFNTINLHPTGQDWRTISAQGFTIANIKAVGKVITKSDLSSTKAIYRLFRRTVIDKQLATNQGNDMALPTFQPAELGLVLLAGTHFDPEPAVAQQEPVEKFNDFVDAFCAASDESPAKAITLLDNKASARYIRGLKWAATHRRLLITTDGRFGIGPRAVREDDTLVVLSASRVPLIMRQSGTGWQVVGPCYVHGIMHGEAVADWRSKTEKPTEFLVS